MSTRSEERTQFLADIITSAIEGGTGYWACVHQYQYMMDDTLHPCIGALVPDAGARATIQDEDDDKLYELTIDVIARGISAIRATRDGINTGIRQSIITGDNDNDAGEIDADGADAIVQFAIFGRLVYG